MRRINLCRISILLIFTIVIGCSKQSEKGIVGLWVVEKVQMGEQSMTPIARWMRFETDSTQTSGNGWFQHSYGSWSMNGDQLRVIDVNGITDEFEPFKISLNEDKMTWIRNEEGQGVTVHLKRATKVPASKGNQLIGLWKLTKATDQENDITAITNPDDKAMMHLRWDYMYVQHNMPKGRRFGVYKIHAHKPEIQLVNYGNESQFSFWNFSLEGNKLLLKSTDQKSTMEFERIHQFLK